MCSTVYVVINDKRYSVVLLLYNVSIKGHIIINIVKSIAT